MIIAGLHEPTINDNKKLETVTSTSEKSAVFLLNVKLVITEFQIFKCTDQCFRTNQDRKSGVIEHELEQFRRMENNR
jgi:hypothetical protein